VSRGGVCGIVEVGRERSRILLGLGGSIRGWRGV